MPIRPADGFAWSEDNVLHELGRLFESFRGTGPAVVLFDDVRFAPDALHVTVAAALRGGCTVVAGCHDDGGTALPLPFGASADRVLDLEPLADQAVDQLVAATVGQPVDPAVGPAVRAALGSLAGNPGAVLAVCDRLRLQRGLVYAKGAWCLADPATPIGLPPEHWLVRTAEQVATNGPQLVTLIAGVDRFTVDDLIDYVAVTGHDLDKCGRAVDDLTAVGALSHTSGVDLTVACPALATTLLAAADARQLRDLHRKIAGHLLRRNGDPALDLAKVAGHLAAAGAPATTDPAAASLLAREAGKVLPTNPALAARWYRAALAHVDSENPCTNGFSPHCSGCWCASAATTGWRRWSPRWSPPVTRWTWPGMPAWPPFTPACRCPAISPRPRPWPSSTAGVVRQSRFPVPNCWRH